MCRFSNLHTAVRRNKPLALALLLGPALLAPAAAANASIFYSNNFERGAQYAEWSSNQTFTTHASFSRFLGRYTNTTTTLTIPAPPITRDAPTSPGGEGGGGTPSPRGYLLNFSFYCIDSWDGYEPTNGIDRFGIRVNNTTVFYESFANQHTGQSYAGRPVVGPTQLGFDGRWNDSIYYLSIPFYTDAPILSIDFFAHGLHGSMNDESWGVDNITLSSVPVPTPGGAALIALGGVFAIRRRR